MSVQQELLRNNREPVVAPQKAWGWLGGVEDGRETQETKARSRVLQRKRSRLQSGSAVGVPWLIPGSMEDVVQ